MEARKTVSIGPFKGLDRRPNRFSLDPSRAIDEGNYVYKNGIVQKRDGFEEILDVSPTHYIRKKWDGTFGTEFAVNSCEFNGIWQFKAEDGQSHVIAHIGRLLYEVFDIATDKCEARPIVTDSDSIQHDGYKYVYAYQFEDYKSFAVVGDNALYFFGGNKYMKLRFLPSGTVKFGPVENDPDTYCPTTTISIGYQYAKSSARATLDNVNMLNDFRKNTILTGVGKDTTAPANEKHFRYVMDAPLITRDTPKDMAKFSIVLNVRKQNGN